MKAQLSQQRVAIEARRAKVSELLIQRLSYRDIAAMLDCSDATIAADVKHLRKQWAKTHEDAGATFERAAMDQDRLQKMIIDYMGQVAPEDQAALVGRLISLMDQRNRLHGLYPKAGAGEEKDIPQGPIQLQIEVIQPGNRNLIEDDEDSEPVVLDDDD